MHIIFDDVFNSAGKYRVAPHVGFITLISTTQLEILLSFRFEVFRHLSVIAPAIAKMTTLFDRSTNRNHLAKHKRNIGKPVAEEGIALTKLKVDTNQRWQNHAANNCGETQ